MQNSSQNTIRRKRHNRGRVKKSIFQYKTVSTLELCKNISAEQIPAPLQCRTKPNLILFYKIRSLSVTFYMHIPFQAIYNHCYLILCQYWIPIVAFLYTDLNYIIIMSKAYREAASASFRHTPNSVPLLTTVSYTTLCVTH